MTLEKHQFTMVMSYHNCLYMKVMKISILFKKILCKQALWYRPRRAPPPLALGWYFSTRLAGDESAALRLPAVSRDQGGLCSPDAPPLPSQAAARARASPRTKGSQHHPVSARFLPLPNMKKAEVGRFSISPDEDSSSYSSNGDFNYSYPTKQAALKRWEMCASFKAAYVHRKFFT